jgi:Septum formation
MTMRRWLAALVGTAALAGCSAGLPEGVDGDLTNGWKLPPAAVAWQPQNAKCFDDLAETSSQQEYAPITCQERHVAETYAVGVLAGHPASRQAAQGGAYMECARRADGYAGGQWAAARLIVQPVLPDDLGWKAGARWYRCDMAERDDVGDLVGRDASLRDALKHEPDLLLRCFNPTVSGEDVQTMASVDCARAHHAEFVGLWTAPKIALKDLEGSPQLGKGCLSAIARYTKVPNDSMIKYRTGWLGFPGGDQAWNAGDRTVQCFLWLSGETMKGSYRGAGPNKLKINYA